MVIRRAAGQSRLAHLLSRRRQVGPRTRPCDTIEIQRWMLRGECALSGSRDPARPIHSSFARRSATPAFRKPSTARSI